MPKRHPEWLGKPVGLLKYDNEFLAGPFYKNRPILCRDNGCRFTLRFVSQGLCSPENAPLERIFFLKHAKANSIKQLNQLDVASRLVICSFPTFWDNQGMDFTLRFLTELAEGVPCYELGFIPDKSALDFIREKI